LTISQKVTIPVLLKCQLCFLGTPPFALVFPIVNLIITGDLSLPTIEPDQPKLTQKTQVNKKSGVAESSFAKQRLTHKKN
jgi:hypothetical protein